MPRPPGPLVLRKTYDSQKYADALQKLTDRMAFLVERDGPIEQNYPIPHHAWRNIGGMTTLYTNTGDPTFLLDSACYALIEYLRPSLPKPWNEANPD